jgi:hypothetical protein
MALLPYQPLLPFSILTYPANPNFSQIGQTIVISPSPGFSAVSYAITSGASSLPPGFIFNTTTGVFTGTPTALTTVPAVLEVTATFVDSTTSVCQVTLNVIDFPPSATASNRASATGLNDNKQLAETRFLESAEMIVNNSNLLGLFHAYLELPDYVTFRFAWFYFSRLNYTVVDLNPSNNNAEFSSFFGEYPSFPGLVTPGFENYNDFTQYPASVKSRPARRIRLSWSQFSGYPCSFPWLPYYPIPFNGV